MGDHQTTQLTARNLRDAFGAFPTGVTIITARRPDGQPVGITANSFASVSLDPPMVLWCIARESTSVAAFAKGADFAVTILGERQKDIALHFAGRATAKFPGGAPPGPHGPAPLVPGAHTGRLDCIVENQFEGGDHLIILGRVKAIDRKGGPPLGFHDGRFGKFTTDTYTPQVDIWDSLGIELPSFFKAPFD